MWEQASTMVKGVGKFRRRLKNVPDKVRDELVLAMQRAADRVVRDMRVLMYSRAGLTDADVEINWTWGKAPKGAVTYSNIRAGKSAGQQYASIGITVYARGRGFSARWFEHGTKRRYHKSGKTTGQIKRTPFFYPGWSANRKNVRTAMRNAVRRGFRKA